MCVTVIALKGPTDALVYDLTLIANKSGSFNYRSQGVVIFVICVFLSMHCSIARATSILSSKTSHRF